MGPLTSFQLDHSDGLPVWMQLRNKIAYLIASGSYHEGDKLPTVRVLADELDVSQNTVIRAYMDLEREGYIISRKGKGTFVIGNNVAASEPERVAFGAMVDDVIRAARSIGMDNKSILAMVKEKLGCSFASALFDKC